MDWFYPVVYEIDGEVKLFIETDKSSNANKQLKKHYEGPFIGASNVVVLGPYDDEVEALADGGMLYTGRLNNK